MQQFKPYYTGEADPVATIHPTLGRPLGLKNAASIQKSFRTSDIDEVGDERHLTFFEMMGNFSFGGYFKEDAIRYAYEFLTREMGLEIEYVTVFEGLGTIGVPEDTESQKIWRALDPGITIVKQGMDDVFWGPTGSSGPCGPTTEIYCKNGAGQDIEVWNIVFNEFFFAGSREELLAGGAGKKLERLKTPGVDTGMGLERLAMCAQKTSTIFETDLFSGMAAALPAPMSAAARRIFLDHARASVFLICDGVRPSNRGAGYTLRRLMRRVMAHEYLIHANARQYFGEDADLTGFVPRDYYFDLARAVAECYGEAYSDLNATDAQTVIGEEWSRFEQVVKNGLRELARSPARLSAQDSFRLSQSFGLSFEAQKDIDPARTAGLTREAFDAEFKKHQEVSRAGSVAKFGGHGLYMKTGEVTIRDESEVERVTRLHTATHLLHAALRAALGPDVRQDGSDITVERTRFDFRFPRKVAPDELKEVERWVNDAIRRDLRVSWEEMAYEDAVRKGALGFFRQKYPPRVKVYTMADAATGEVFSREFCGGPHVGHTGEVGVFKILKEEASSAGVRRIRGTVG